MTGPLFALSSFPAFASLRFCCFPALISSLISYRTFCHVSRSICCTRTVNKCTLTGVGSDNRRPGIDDAEQCCAVEAKNHRSRLQLQFIHTVQPVAETQRTQSYCIYLWDSVCFEEHFMGHRPLSTVLSAAAGLAPPGVTETETETLEKMYSSLNSERGMPKMSIFPEQSCHS